MKTKVKWNLVTGDPNLVTENEIYVEYAEDGSVYKLSKRNASGSLVPFLFCEDIVEDEIDEAIDDYIEGKVESSKAYTLNILDVQAGDTIEVTPTSGKDSMEKVVITITNALS